MALRSNTDSRASPGAADHVARTLRQRIRRGEWEVGSRLPSVRALASEFGVSINTVQRSLGQLEAEQLIECKQRQPGLVKAWHSRVVPAPSRLGNQVAAVYKSQRLLDPAPVPLESWTFGILGAAEACLAKNRRELVHLAVPSDRAEFMRSAVERLDELGEKLIGLIFFEDDYFSDLSEEADRRKIPWVVINRPDRRYQHNFVTSNHIDAGLRAGRCLVQQGLRRVLVIGSDMTAGMAGVETMSGFVQSFFEAGLPLSTIDYVNGIPTGEKREAWSHAQTLAYIDTRERPEAIFCMGDWLALGAIRACRERGLRVPEDVSVIGTTGLAIGVRSDPPLTVLAQPIDKIGTTAASMLLEMHREGRLRTPGVVLPAELIVRKSLKLPEDASGL